MAVSEYAEESAMKASYVERLEHAESKASSPIIEVLGTSDDAIAKLHAQIGRMIDRLDPLTQPEDDQKMSPGITEVSFPKSELVLRVEAQTRSIIEAGDRIGRALALLDL